MNWLYIPQLLIQRIDDVVIGLLTGLITGLFISRIFLVSQENKERFDRVQQRTESLNKIYGGLSVFVMDITEIKISSLNQIAKETLVPLLEYETVKFGEMIFDDLDKELHEISADHNTLLENILNDLKSQTITKKQFIDYVNKINVIMNKYQVHRKNRDKVVFKDIISDKYVIVILIILISSIIIA